MRTRSPASPPKVGRHRSGSDGFEHVADIMVGSFYDPELEEGRAFEELIRSTAGSAGPQTRAFILHPSRLALPAEPPWARQPFTSSSRAGGGALRTVRVFRRQQHQRAHQSTAPRARSSS